MTQPMQPLETVDGILRFKPNAIVKYLLDHGPVDMNALARLEFSDEDREQFAQLLGYSLCGYAELYYVTDASCDEVEAARLLHTGEVQ